MLTNIHPTQTRRLADEQDEYLSLSISDRQTEDGQNVMESIWEPTPTELEMLKEGGVVVLQILGRIHPPVFITAATVERD